jgi:hypothetical protein
MRFRSSKSRIGGISKRQLNHPAPKEMPMLTTRKTAVAAVLAAIAIAAPSANAQPIDTHLTTTVAPAGTSSDLALSDGAAEAASTSAASPNGFDWGDAGVGAAAVLSVIGLGAGAVIYERRSRHARPAAD